MGIGNKQTSIKHNADTSLQRLQHYPTMAIQQPNMRDKYIKQDMDTTTYYREAVIRLRYFLADSLRRRQNVSRHDDNSTQRNKRRQSEKETSEVVSLPSTKVVLPYKSSPELMLYMQNQELYIQQLERENQFYQDEMFKVVRKMRSVISENDFLRNKNRSKPDKSVKFLLETEVEQSESEDDVLHPDNEKSVDSVDCGYIKTDKGCVKKNANQCNILYESRISELEALLTRMKMELKNSQIELEKQKTQLLEKSTYSDPCKSDASLNKDNQIRNLQREKDELCSLISQLRSSIENMRESETIANKKMKQVKDNMEQIVFDKAMTEQEARCLNAELDHLKAVHKDMLQEHSRVKKDAEHHHNQQIEKLIADLQEQCDKNNRTMLELEKQKRIETELSRELYHKNNVIEDLKKEFNNNRELQNEISSMSSREKSLDNELASVKLQADRVDRNNKQEIDRLRIEIKCLQQRLDRTDAELTHSRNENIRLNEQIKSLGRQFGSNVLPRKTINDQEPKREQEITRMILDMDTKHGKNISDLENMIQSQSELIDCLKEDCTILTQKLDDANIRHKEEMAHLQNNLEYLNSKIVYDTTTVQQWDDGEVAYERNINEE